jgi:hypothetical protein
MFSKEGTMKKVLFILAALIIIGSPVMAFHDAGVAHCNGCHTMHNSQDGALVDADSPNGNAWLLKQSTPSDTCLACHGPSYGAVFTSDPLAPPTTKGGGNFVFLLEDNLNDGHAGASSPILGHTGGHNIISIDKGVVADPVLSTAPGGTFSSANLACSSCHDPHGNANFRLLYGAGRLIQDGLGGTFLNAAPVAEGLGLFGAGESNTNHTAYQSGMSAWCGNCHGDFHNEAGGRLEHPSGSTLGGSTAAVYNAYNGTDDQTGGVVATSYLAAVPFESIAPGNTTSSTAGPGAGSMVMCLTCHRAHASSAPDAGRWDFNVTFLHEDGAESGSYPIPDPYASVNQRSLCNKCHNKDQDDAPFTP